MSDIETVEVPTRKVAVIRRTVTMADVTGFFEEAFTSTAGAVTAAGAAIAGPPFGWYHGVPTDEADITAGFPVDDDLTAVPVDGVELQERPGGPAVVAVHVGPYDTLVATYGEVEAWMAERGLTSGDDMWEEYLSDPAQEPDPTTWRTRIVLPLVPQATP